MGDLTRLKILHVDFKRLVLTCEVTGIRRFWTPLVILTCEEVDRVLPGSTVDLWRP